MLSLPVIAAHVDSLSPFGTNILFVNEPGIGIPKYDGNRVTLAVHQFKSTVRFYVNHLT